MKRKVSHTAIVLVDAQRWNIHKRNKIWYTIYTSWSVHMRYLRRVVDVSEIGWVNGPLIGYNSIEYEKLRQLFNECISVCLKYDVMVSE